MLIIIELNIFPSCAMARMIDFPNENDLSLMVIIFIKWHINTMFLYKWSYVNDTGHVCEKEKISIIVTVL